MQPALTQQAKQLAIQIIRDHVRQEKMAVLNESMNVDHARRLFFIHNPKCMGTSLKQWLGLRVDNADHRFPTLTVNRMLWEAYTTIVVVRHPIDRFVSSFNFHCRSNYAGGYTVKYPDLKSWDMAEYFERMRLHEPLAIAPQWKYTVHLQSDAPPDFLIRMEDAAEDIQRLAGVLGIGETLPGLNRSSGRKESPEPALLDQLTDYYALDFQLFGYTA